MTTLNTTEVAAVSPFDGIKMHHATRKAADKLNSLLRAEYPALHLRAITDEDEVTPRLLKWEVVYTTTPTDKDSHESIYEGDKVPSLAEIIDLCADADLDPEAGIEDDEDDEPKASGSVVSETYRQQYRYNSSNGQTCGDWLAEQLVAETHSTEGFRPDDFTAILNNNEVDMTSAWAKLPFSGQKGWVGRYRMNGRQVLEKIVARNSYYVDLLGNKITPDAKWLAVMRDKHSKWIAKQDKAEAAATAAVKTAVEA